MHHGVVPYFLENLENTLSTGPMHTQEKNSCVLMYGFPIVSKSLDSMLPQ